MNRFTLILTAVAMALTFGVHGAMAQANQDYTFDVDNSKAPVKELSEAEEDAFFAGDKSDITTEDSRFPKEAPPDLIPTPPLTADAEVEKPVIDPCAVYTSARGRMICEDRMMKIERMKAAKDKRSETYARGMGQKKETPPAEPVQPAVDEMPAETPAPTVDPAMADEALAPVEPTTMTGESGAQYYKK